MDISINAKVKKINVEIGDIVVIGVDESLYMMMEISNSQVGKFQLISLSGKGRWTSWETLYEANQEIKKDGGLIYKKQLYELNLVEKQEGS